LILDFLPCMSVQRKNECSLKRAPDGALPGGGAPHNGDVTPLTEVAIHA
jgi:hypothetical protein